MLFDLRAPLKPTLVTSFGDLDGYMHPHTYVRLPNRHVLITFQYRRAHGPNAEGGGLVQVTPGGELVRSSSATDPAAPAELIRPYSPLVIPALDRVVTTNTAMHEADGNTRTVAVGGDDRDRFRIRRLRRRSKRPFTHRVRNDGTAESPHRRP